MSGGRNAGATRRPGRRGPLAWMAANSVAANLLMAIAVVAGAMALTRTKQEVFPEFDLDIVQVSVAYPGASPREVEQGILYAIEEELRGLDGVDRVTATALEGRGVVQAELQLGAEADAVLSDAKNAVDGIQSFPEQAEEPAIEVLEQRRQVITLVIAADQPRPVLERVAERARQRLLDDGSVTQVELRDLPTREIQIEVPRQQLEAHELDLTQLAHRVGRLAVEVPAGELETPAGEVAVRMADRRDVAHRFGALPIAGSARSGSVRLADVAGVQYGYANTDVATFYQGKPAVRLIAYRVGSQTPTHVARAVKDLARELRAELPPGFDVLTWNDDSRILRERIGLLVDNALIGFGLVLVVLGALLNARLAGWVAVGIPVSFMGAFALFPLLGLSVNMITLFALIITLGLVVDDAIIVGESIYQKREEGLQPLDAAVEGAREVARPVFFAIATTLTAFAPMFFVPGVTGKIFSLIPAVVYAVLALSLVECFLVLPAHLAHSGARAQSSARGRVSRLGTRVRENAATRRLGAASSALSRGLTRFSENGFRRACETALRHRYSVIALALGVLGITASLVVSGILAFQFFPEVEANRVLATARLAHGAPLSETRAVGEALRRGAQRAIGELDAEQASRGVLTRLGASAPDRDAASVAETGSHLVTVQLELVTAEQRSVRAAEIAQAWEKALGPLPAVRSLRFEHDAGPSAGSAVDVQLRHPDRELLGQASGRVAEALRADPRVFNVVDGFAAGSPQMDFRLLPEAERLGIDAQQVASQLRAALYGAEALRQQDGRDEVRVMVRLPPAQRDSLRDLDALHIRAPDGRLVPLRRVAEVEWTSAPTRIQREAGQRVVHVTAALRPDVDSASPTLEGLQQRVFPGLRERFPDLELRFAGERREQREAFSSLGAGYVVALFAMYVLLAVPFRSYLRPAVIMAVIPFGLVGAALGHLVMGYNLSIVSMFGLVALSGVVVNDSVVLLDRVPAQARSDRERRLVEAAQRRMRPILLTSLTTFLGLAPMIFETSMQARFLIPMALSLGFGVLGATVIVLFLLPCLDLALADLQGALRRGRTGESRSGQLARGSGAASRS